MAAASGTPYTPRPAGDPELEGADETGGCRNGHSQGHRSVHEEGDIKAHVDSEGQKRHPEGQAMA